MHSTPLTGYFCLEAVFKVLEKGLDYAPIQNKINEPELRNDFSEFRRRIRLKWFFRKEVTRNFSEVPAFRPKSLCNPKTLLIWLVLYCKTIILDSMG